MATRFATPEVPSPLHSHELSFYQREANRKIGMRRRGIEIYPAANETDASAHRRFIPIGYITHPIKTEHHPESRSPSWSGAWDEHVPKHRGATPDGASSAGSAFCPSVRSAAGAVCARTTLSVGWLQIALASSSCRRLLTACYGTRPSHGSN